MGASRFLRAEIPFDADDNGVGVRGDSRVQQVLQNIAFGLLCGVGHSRRYDREWNSIFGPASSFYRLKIFSGNVGTLAGELVNHLGRMF